MLMERVLATGKTKLLASNALAQFGLASTATRVVFADRGRSGPELVAVRHDGGGRLVLTRSLAAPIAARGDLVAWAEQSASSQRVVVRHMRTGREWVAAQMSRCRRGRCYRIDSVTLADKGVVFERGAIGPHPSLIVRRGFGEDRVTTTSVAHDPQPELAASSAGALFYRLQHGWFRWDFGQRRPHLVKLPASRLVGARLRTRRFAFARRLAMRAHADTQVPPPEPRRPRAHVDPRLAEGVRPALSPDDAFPLARQAACRRMVDHSQDQPEVRRRRRARRHRRRSTNT